ncbi:MAG TPA: SGNH/GDSL hydrolase family protein [Kribbella sp.]|uniref:SGNH/GDSL hydrolase family protein n=1 Tax=Kribbella sp. TaxID=1871183 RepID=UPI002D76DF16|nr:SGNH/GDSL hydrolase family protein [Kribbella sp.]HET6293449.1 SGNH/GDSL hydrolase family protein [Kribbella sp.]
MLLADTWLQSLFTAIATVAASLPAGAPVAPAQVVQAEGWVGSWAVAVTEAGASGVAAAGVADTTVRQVAHLSVGGRSVRLRLSNRFGNRPLVVGRTTVAPRKDGAAGTPNLELLQLIPVTFGGRGSITIPVGGEAVSDPVDTAVAEDSDLVISTYFPGPTGPLTQHPAGYATAFAARGDQTGAGGAPYRKISGMARFVVDEVDVQANARGSVVLFGDSITDGASSPIDGNLRYPDQLADLLTLQRYGALNAGIGGNKLLANGGTAGEAAIGRFERDVIRRTGVRSVVILEGINDIRGSRGSISATALINAHRQLIARAHEAGLKAYGATLTPYWGYPLYTVGGEVARQALNHWIRTSGEYDGVIDLEQAIRDPNQPLRILPAYDSGDHLHPNARGFTAMARSFNLELFTS